MVVLRPLVCAAPLNGEVPAVLAAEAKGVALTLEGELGAEGEPHGSLLTVRGDQIKEARLWRVGWREEVR